MTCKPIIFGCSCESLTDDEALFFKDVNPFGFILFQRNVKNPDQLKKLTRQLKDTIGREDVPIFVDKEGGRVTRLKPPYWPALPSMRTLGELYEKNPEDAIDAIRLHSQITAYRLINHGINGNCAPVLDLKIDGADDVIGDRAFSHNPEHVINCARIVIDTFMSCGVYPVVKHIPGHGRVKVDPHDTLPFVDTDKATLENEDFAPFKALNDAPMAMSCHVVFKALDSAKPVTLSKKVNQDIIRNHIGFNGLLMTDDLAMGAISIPMERRGVDAIDAGADIALHCSGIFEQMEAIAKQLPDMSKLSLNRWQNAQEKILNAREHTDEKDLQSMEESFLGMVS